MESCENASPLLHWGNPRIRQMASSVATALEPVLQGKNPNRAPFANYAKSAAPASSKA
jgi:hypothetical protein